MNSQHWNRNLKTFSPSIQHQIEQLCMCVCVCVCVCVCLFVCVCDKLSVIMILFEALVMQCNIIIVAQLENTYIHTHTYVRTYIHTFICTHIHTYIHTYILEICWNSLSLKVDMYANSSVISRAAPTLAGGTGERRCVWRTAPTLAGGTGERRCV